MALYTASTGPSPIEAPSRLALHPQAHRRRGNRRGAAVAVQVLELEVSAAPEAVRRASAPPGLRRAPPASCRPRRGSAGTWRPVPAGRVRSPASPAGRAVRPAGARRQHHPALGESHVLRTHDLVGLAVLQESVHVDAGAVRKGIGADHRLVGAEPGCRACRTPCGWCDTTRADRPRC